MFTKVKKKKIVISASPRKLHLVDLTKLQLQIKFLVCVYILGDSESDQVAAFQVFKEHNIPYFPKTQDKNNYNNNNNNAVPNKYTS